MSSNVNLTVSSSMSAVLGAESKGFDIDPAKTFSVQDAAHDVTANVVGGGSAVTLWDSSASPLTAFQCGAVIIDPEANAQGQSPPQAVDIRTTVNGVTHLQRRDRNVVMQFGVSAQGTGAITKIEAVPVSGGAAGTNDVRVRCLLFGVPS
jgi:hypothetical protein